MDRIRWQDGIFWLLCYSLLWVVLARGGWAFAVPSVALATILTLWLQKTSLHLHFNFRQLPAFLIFFLKSMIAGAWDVALRALHPRMPVSPRWVEYRLVSTNPRTQLLCSVIVGLLPGTLAPEVDRGIMRVHVLDIRQDWQQTLRQLDQHLDRLLTPREVA
jgi:multicomponent Na+:H+ antiporter subunit E